MISSSNRRILALVLSSAVPVVNASERSVLALRHPTITGVARRRTPAPRRPLFCRHFSLHVPLSPFRSYGCPITPSNRHVPLAPFSRCACPMTVEAAPEPKCLQATSCRGRFTATPACPGPCFLSCHRPRIPVHEYHTATGPPHIRPREGGCARPPSTPRAPSAAIPKRVSTPQTRRQAINPPETRRRTGRRARRLAPLAPCPIGGVL